MISVNNFQSIGSNTGITSLSLPSYNVGTGATGNRVLCVFILTELNPTGPGATSVEWNGAGGIAFTKAAAVTETQNTSEIWYLNDTDIGTGPQTNDILVTFSGSPSNSGIAAVWLDGASQSGPEQTVINSNPNSAVTSIAATINSVLPSSIVLNSGGIGDGRSLIQDGTQTKEGEQVQSSSALALASEMPGAGNHTQGWTFSGSRRPSLILAEWAEAPSRLVANIDGDNNIHVGQANITISTVGLNISPTTQTVTLGGQALTVINWNNGNPIVSIPVDIQLKWGRTDLQLAVTDDTGTVTLDNVTLSPEAGWEYVDFNGTPPGPQTESGYELAQTDFGYSMVLGDQWIFKSESGLSYDAQTLPTLNPPATITSEYRVWNDSAASLTPKATYTIAQKPVLSNGAFTHPG